MTTFSATLYDPNNVAGAYRASISACLQTAGDQWAQKIVGQGTIEVLVDFASLGSGVLAESGAETSLRIGSTGGVVIFEPGTEYETQTGIDPNGQSPDIGITLNTEWISRLFYDPTFSRPVPADRTDAVSLFEHEIGHGLAFGGWLNQANGSNPGYESVYDSFVRFDSGRPYFTGANAVAAYGRAVPLTQGSYAHYGNDAPGPGSDLLGHVMFAHATNGVRAQLNDLDFAILKDCGYAIAGPAPDPVSGPSFSYVAHGSAESDVLDGTAGNDQLFGEAGDDFLFGHGGDDSLVGGDGRDVIHGEDGNDRLEGGSSNDELHGGNGNDKLFGGDSEDTLFGGTGEDELRGDSGNDMLSGEDGQDTLYGGTGDDRLFGNDGDDILHGEDGTDRLEGGLGKDDLHGGDGNDQLSGGDNDDTLFGGTGEDELRGDNGNDMLSGEQGQDQLFGGSGEDRLIGGEGDDRLFGEDGEDRLFGEDGNDRLEGGSGTDRLEGGRGDDTLVGGDAADTFVFAANFGRDTIADFRPEDVIEFQNGLFANFSAVLSHTAQSGGDTIINDDAGDTLILQGIQRSSLAADDFRFV